jgi:hypothetical protein
MHEFSGIFAEREYLRSAPPAEVFKYLDGLSSLYVKKTGLFSTQSLPKDTQEVLFKRNELIIDVGLVRLADDELIESILYRYYPENAIRNKQIIKLADDEDLQKYNIILTSSFSSESVGSLFSTPRWVKLRLEWIAQSSDKEQLSMLLRNPNLATELIEQILAKKDWCANLDQDRYVSMLWMLLSNKIIELKPEDDHEYDMSQHGIISGCWMLLSNLEKNKGTAALLSENIHRFQELEIPYSYKKNQDTEASDWRKTAVNSRKEFLGEMLTKWTCLPEEDDEYGHLKFYCDRTRSFMVEKIGAFYLGDLKGFIFSTGDLLAIEGYYAGVDLSAVKLEKFESNYKKYGTSFLFGLIRNKDIFIKSSRHSNALCLNLWAVAREFEKTDGMDDWNTPAAEFDRFLEIRRKQDSSKYIANVGDLHFNTESDPNKEVNLNDKFLEIQRTIASLGNKNTDSLKASDLASLFEIVNKKLDLTQGNFENAVNSLTVAIEVSGRGVDKNLRSNQNKSIFLGLLLGFLLGWILM